MQRAAAIVVGVAGLLVTVACGTGPAPAPPATNYQLATLRDVMQAIVAPNAEVLWNAVSFVSTLKGTEEKMPRTDEEWAVVDHAAVALMESTNLMQIPGRQIARPGEKTESPEVNLAHDQIAALVDTERTAWVGFAVAMHGAVATAREAIRRRNGQGLQAAGDAINQACEGCHLKFWYPPKVAAATAAAPDPGPGHPPALP